SGTAQTPQRYPDFFVVGHHKSGTSALYEMLRRHPQIFMPKIKEPQYLASDLRPRPGFENEPRERGYPKTLQEYLALFSGASSGQRIGEATPLYLWSHTAADRIAEMQPDARLIAVLREPASFLRSLHLAVLQGGNEAETDFRRAMSLESARREGRDIPSSSHRPQLLQYSDHVRYVEQLSRYRARFPAEQILVLIYDDFRADNDGTMRRVLRFLEVDDELPISLEWVNPSKHSGRSRRAGRIMDSLSRGRGPVARSTRATFRALTTLPVRRAVRMSVDRLMSADKPSEDSFTTELRLRFKPEVEALSNFLDRDLVRLWGYEALD
ncbi:MAG: sulfotransferase family protein, partial [Solirubrobacteraceae bacterium]